MSALGCCLWWFVLGALAGWLGSWLLNRLFGRSDVREIPETRVAAPIAVAPASAPVAPVAVVPPRVAGDDLTIIEGIGPKIAELLRRNGIDTFAALSRRTSRRSRPFSRRPARGSRSRTPAPGRRRPSTAFAATGRD